MKKQATIFMAGENARLGKIFVAVDMV